MVSEFYPANRQTKAPDKRMSEELSPENLINCIKQSFGEFCDVRKGKNTQYVMVDAGVGAFSVFFTQSPSFLSSQEDMKKANGRCNAESLFGMHRIPCDNQIRSLLDPVEPASIAPVYRDIFERLERSGGAEKLSFIREQTIGNTGWDAVFFIGQATLRQV